MNATSLWRPHKLRVIDGYTFDCKQCLALRSMKIHCSGSKLLKLELKVRYQFGSSLCLFVCLFLIMVNGSDKDVECNVCAQLYT